jgi:hypothetical protein
MMTYGSGIKKARSHEWQPRDKNGRWTQHAERMKHQGFLDKLRRLKTLAEDRAAPNATEMPGFFQRLAQIAGKVKKDMDVGDVHIAAALGGDKAGRRKKKYPPLSFARLPNGEVK